MNLFLEAKIRGKIVLREIVRRLFPGVKQIFEQSLVYSDSLVSFQGACLMWHVTIQHYQFV